MAIFRQLLVGSSHLIQIKAFFLFYRHAFKRFVQARQKFFPKEFLVELLDHSDIGLLCLLVIINLRIQCCGEKHLWRVTFKHFFQERCTRFLLVLRCYLFGFVIHPCLNNFTGVGFYYLSFAIGFGGVHQNLLLDFRTDGHGGTLAVILLINDIKALDNAPTVCDGILRKLVVVQLALAGDNRSHSQPDSLNPSLFKGLCPIGSLPNGNDGHVVPIGGSALKRGRGIVVNCFNILPIDPSLTVAITDFIPRILHIAHFPGKNGDNGIDCEIREPLALCARLASDKNFVSCQLCFRWKCRYLRRGHCRPCKCDNAE